MANKTATEILKLYRDMSMNNGANDQCLRTLIERLAEYVELVPDDRYNAEHLDRDALVAEAERILSDWDGE